MPPQGPSRHEAGPSLGRRFPEPVHPYLAIFPSLPFSSLHRLQIRRGSGSLTLR